LALHCLSRRDNLAPVTAAESHPDRRYCLIQIAAQYATSAIHPISVIRDAKIKGFASTYSQLDDEDCLPSAFKNSLYFRK
jgi:hypothetical protein